MNKTTLQELQDKFNSEFNEVKDQLYLINRELNSIAKFLEFDSYRYSKNKLDRFNFLTPKPKHIFELHIPKHYNTKFADAFDNYILYEKVEESSDDGIKSIIYQAVEFAKYANWLKNLKKEVIEKEDQKYSELFLNQKLLALHYLGLNLIKYDNTKTAKILRQILNQGEENIRKGLSFVEGRRNKLKTIENLKITLNLFDIQGLEEITAKIKEDIERL